jgi:hypothetical protein
MKSFWLIALLMTMFLILVLLPGCECGDDDDDDNDSGDDDSTGDDDDTVSDDDDDDDDDAVGPLKAESVFVLPNYHYAKTDEEIRGLVAAIAEAGSKNIIWQWTLHYDRVCYPSETFREFPGMQSEDLIGTLLDNAEGVYLGLSAARRPAEAFDDPVGPEAERVELLIEDLTERYGDSDSLLGFYLPYEFIHAPNADEINLLTRIADAAHEALPGTEVLLSAGYPGPDQYHYVVHVLDNWFYPGMSQDDIDDSAERETWARNLVAALDSAGIDVLLLKSKMGNHRNDRAEARLDLDVVMREVRAQGAMIEVRLQVDAYDTVTNTGRMRRVPGPASEDLLHQQRSLALEFGVKTAAFSWDNWANGEDDLVPPQAGTDLELYEKALAIEQHVRSRGIRDGQVVTVIDGQQPLDMFGNWWQEDACWITGLYLGAESFRCAVTGEQDACDYARRLWRVIHKMANVTPLAGEVVRNYASYFYGQPTPVDPSSSTIKRWHRDPDNESYWVGDISVDQLSGYFYGLWTFYELVADEDERATIEQDMANIMGLIVENNLKAHEYNGLNATYGDLRAAPELATTFLLMAWRMTGDEIYLQKFNRLVYLENYDWKVVMFHFALHLVKNYGGQHFQDTGLYHMYSLLPEDPELYRRLIWGTEYVYQGSFTWGNAMADFTHQNHTPDSAGAARALHDHYMYDAGNLDNAVWAANVNQDYGENYMPMQLRPYDEWDWTQSPQGKLPRGSVNYRYPGVSYLVTYWEGRWHGWIP